MAEGFGYNCFGGCVMAALTLMNISEQLQPLVRLDTVLENASCAEMKELVVDDGVCARSALDLPSLNFVLRKSATHEKITEQLRPGGSGYYHQDCSSDGLDCLCGAGVDCILHNTVSPRADDSSPWNAVGSPWCCWLC